jgi:hypothetical protein
MIWSSQAASFVGAANVDEAAMRKVREILRLRYDGKLPSREVGRQVEVP